MAKKKKVEKVEKETVPVDKNIKEKENRQLFWILVFVVFLIAAVLIPYFWVESTKSFSYVGADWKIEDYEDLRIYHGRFSALDGSNLNYNIYLRGDPRRNDVLTEGVFDTFKYGGIVAISPEVDECRGEISRVMIDLGGFLRKGVGLNKLEVASNDKFVANENDRLYATCGVISDRTLIEIELGEESKVVKNEKNPYCYTIYVEDCEDISSVEKFMIKTLEDFGEKNNSKV